jgi:hypothetical protein
MLTWSSAASRLDRARHAEDENFECVAACTATEELKLTC